MARTTKPVFIVGTGQTFPSASAAAKALGINPGNLYSVLAGRRKTAGGYQFGYAANRAVSVSKNGETKIYSSVEAAAKAVHANVSKVDRLVSGGINKTVKGYEFSYVDASRVSAGANVVSSSVAAPAPKPKNRKSNKTAQIKAHRAKKQQKQQRTAEREAKRQAEREEAAKKIQRETQLKNMGESYFRYKNARSELESYVKKVNEQLDKYVGENPALLYYHQAAPSVLGLQIYTGWDYGPYDIPYFDESLKKFDLPENLDELSNDELSKIAKRMETINERLLYESERKDANFFDMDEAKKNRTNFAFEFYKNTGHESDMDQYAYMIWDILDVIERSNQYPELGSELIFRMVSDAMQGNVDKYVLDRFIQDLDAWMDEDGSQDELDEILSELHGTYDKPDGYSVFDDEDGWTT